MKYRGRPRVVDVAGAVLWASATYAAIVLATYLYFVARVPSCRGALFRCIKARDLAVIAALVAAQAVVMLLVALLV